MLARSLKYVANVLACPKRVVDLKILAANVRHVCLSWWLQGLPPLLIATSI